MSLRERPFNWRLKGRRGRTPLFLLWTYKPTAQSIDVLAWYQCDHLGTPQELTDQNGNTAWSGRYKAWDQAHEQRSESAQKVGLKNPIRFQGQHHEPETDLLYYRNRYYDPGVGGFISKDPYGYAGGLNLYQCVSNPTCWAITLTDQSMTKARER